MEISETAIKNNEELWPYTKVIMHIDHIGGDKQLCLICDEQ